MPNIKCISGGGITVRTLVSSLSGRIGSIEELL
jgi:hypothetical protein